LQRNEGIYYAGVEGLNLGIKRIKNKNI